MTLKLVIFGIDGAAYPVIQKLVAAGRMPTLSKMMKNGAGGSLQATFPPHTAPGWASLFTGVKPGEHGVYQFWETQSADYSPKIISIHDFGWEPLWKTLTRHGMRVGVVNVPMSHPPSKLEAGYMISWPLSPTIHYSEPRSLTAELAREGLHYHSDLVTMYRGEVNYVEKALAYIDQRTRTLQYLMKKRPVEALMVVYTEVDRVSHYFWGDQEEASPEVEQVYEAIDAALGEMLKQVLDDTLVVVASDHGFGVCRHNLNIHYLLEQAGVMRVALIPDGESQAISSEELIGEDGSPNWFRSTARYVRAIDWDHTYAYMPTPGCFGINLNRRGREKMGIINTNDEAQVVVSQIKKLFQDLRDESGAVMFDVVESSIVYQGHRAKDAPDLLLFPRRWDIMPHPALVPQMWSPPSQSAIHRMEGIVCMRGPYVPEGKLDNAAIEDITPTILSQLGLPVPDESGGKVLFPSKKTDCREPPLRIRKREALALSAQEVQHLETRLAALGYM
jgi:predicted AlkP superfamily phosphohydrolase/phosphomutase